MSTVQQEYSERDSESTFTAADVNLEQTPASVQIASENEGNRILDPVNTAVLDDVVDPPAPKLLDADKPPAILIDAIQTENEMSTDSETVKAFSGRQVATTSQPLRKQSPRKRKRSSSSLSPTISRDLVIRSPRMTPSPPSSMPSLPSVHSSDQLPSIMSSDTSADYDDEADLYWKEEDITGYSENDPEEDNRGVNGIGYQKTKSEQINIRNRKRKQLAGWRAREGQEARIARRGRRSVIGEEVLTSTEERSPKKKKVGFVEKVEEVAKGENVQGSTAAA